MRILAIERPVRGVADLSFTPELAAAEARRAWELWQAGTIRELYFRADETSAVLMLECKDAGRGLEGALVAAARGRRPDRVRSAAAPGISGFRAAVRVRRDDPGRAPSARE